MNLYKISQVTRKRGEVFTDAVVVALDAEQARNMHPSDGRIFDPDVEREIMYDFQMFDAEWTDPDDVIVLFLGVASTGFVEPEVLCSAFIRGI